MPVVSAARLLLFWPDYLDAFLLARVKLRGGQVGQKAGEGNGVKTTNRSQSDERQAEHGAENHNWKGKIKPERATTWVGAARD